MIPDRAIQLLIDRSRPHRHQWKLLHDVFETPTKGIFHQNPNSRSYESGECVECRQVQVKVLGFKLYTKVPGLASFYLLLQIVSL